MAPLTSRFYGRPVLTEAGTRASHSTGKGGAGTEELIVNHRHRLTACCFATLLSLAACGSSSQLMQLNTQSLVSDARDGALLADQITLGRTSAIFARAHAQELQDDVNQAEQNFSDEKLPGYEQLQQLADQLSSTLGSIVTQPDDVSTARQAATELRQLSDKISQVAS